MPPLTLSALQSRPTRAPVPGALVRDLRAVGSLTEQRLPAYQRLRAAVGPETAARLRRLLGGGSV